MRGDETTDLDDVGLAVHGANPQSVDCPYEEAGKDKVRVFVALGPGAQKWSDAVTVGAAFSILVR